MQVHVHIGAHKTGSTRIQALLNGVRRQLFKDERILCFTPAHTRTGKLKTAAKKRGLKVAAVLLKRANAKKARVLVHSEENLLGSMGESLLKGMLYSKARKRLAGALETYAGHDMTIFLSIRAYDSYFTSIYGFRVKKRYVPHFDTFKTRLLSLDGSWKDLILRIKQEFPDAKIVIWDYEDGMNNAERICRRICDAKKRLDFPSDDLVLLPGPSAKGVEELLKLPPDTKPSARAELLKDYPKPKFPAFQPWTSEEANLLQQKYKADLDWLKSLNDTAITFENFSGEEHLQNKSLEYGGN